MDATQTNTKTQRRLGRGLSGLLQSPVAVRPSEGDAAAVASAMASAAGNPAPAAPSAPARPAAQAAKPASAAPPAGEAGARLIEILVTEVTPNQFQPRRGITDEALAGLAESIRSSGVMQPIAVRAKRGAPGSAPGEARYEIVAGERRWRAAMLAGLTRVPAVVVGLDDRGSAEWALVENVQREDLNAIDLAHGLCALRDAFGMTQTAIADRVGLDRSHVANMMRLVELETATQEMIERGALSAGHGKALLASPGGERRAALARKCAEQGWSVRRLEAVIKGGGQFVDPLKVSGLAKEPTRAQAAAKDLEKRLADALGTKVKLRTDASGKRGRIVVEFYDLDQLEGVLKRMGVSGE